MKKFEYKVAWIEIVTDEVLNYYGKEGWELTGFAQTLTGCTFIFKREIEDNEWYSPHDYTKRIIPTVHPEDRQQLHDGVK